MRNERRTTREVPVGNVIIGGENPIVIQSMTATKTQNVEATVNSINQLEAAGAGVVRIAVDSIQDVQALAEIRAHTTANLSVDLQENYRLANTVARYVDKIRYNPGHLYHHEKGKLIQDKVATLAEVAQNNDCALRVGVNCGSVDPELAEKFGSDSTTAMVESALRHADILDRLGFTRYVVSLKDSNPQKVIEANRRFTALRSEIPLHLGVTEAGLPPRGIMKTRIALEALLSEGIGETLRVSLTVPAETKIQEIEVGQQIVDDVAQGRLSLQLAQATEGLNIVSCPSCSRVENSRFVELAEQVREVTKFAAEHNINIAVMGCRVNGPGETSHADLGLWCGPNFVNLRRGEEVIGAFSYDEITPRFLEELNKLIPNR
jgi:(E)-4-hydroxy-3-methylbut-2-enyl-diphosphate synthase